MSKFLTCYKVVMDSANGIALLDTTFLSNFYFRGQANAEWDLSSSLERMIKSLYWHEDILIFLEGMNWKCSKSSNGNSPYTKSIEYLLMKTISSGYLLCNIMVLAHDLSMLQSQFMLPFYGYTKHFK